MEEEHDHRSDLFSKRFLMKHDKRVLCLKHECVPLRTLLRKLLRELNVNASIEIVYAFELA